MRETPRNETLWSDEETELEAVFPNLLKSLDRESYVSLLEMITEQPWLFNEYRKLDEEMGTSEAIAAIHDIRNTHQREMYHAVQL